MQKLCNFLIKKLHTVKSYIKVHRLICQYLLCLIQQGQLGLLQLWDEEAMESLFFLNTTTENHIKATYCPPTMFIPVYVDMLCLQGLL